MLLFVCAETIESKLVKLYLGQSYSDSLMPSVICSEGERPGLVFKSLPPRLLN